MRTLRWMTLALGLIGGVVAVDAIANPPPWAPAHGWRAKHGHGDRYYYEEAPRVVHYRYVYYPEREIYYAPERGLWFWLDGGRWQFGVNLPARYSAYRTGGVSVMLDTDRPYTEHVYVEEHYGRPHRRVYIEDND